MQSTQYGAWPEIGALGGSGEGSLAGVPTSEKPGRRRGAASLSPRGIGPSRGTDTSPTLTRAASSRRGASGASRTARPADVERGSHRPTHPRQPSATSRAPTAPPPVTRPPGGGTAAAPPRTSSDWPPRCHHVAGSWQGVCVCMWGLLCHSYPRRALTRPAWPNAPGSAERAPGADPGGSWRGRMLRAPYIITRLTGAHVSAETAHAANPGLPISYSASDSGQ